MIAKEKSAVDSGVPRMTLLAMVIGTLLLAAFFGMLGVVLFLLNTMGASTVTIFHASLNTTYAGWGSLLIGIGIVFGVAIRVFRLRARSKGKKKKGN
jgi:hypothetical protein